MLLVLFAAAILISSFMISSLKFCFVFCFSPCCVFVTFSREFCEFHEFLEIESFSETHTHTHTHTQATA